MAHRRGKADIGLGWLGYALIGVTLTFGVWPMITAWRDGEAVEAAEEQQILDKVKGLVRKVEHLELQQRTTRDLLIDQANEK